MVQNKYKGDAFQSFFLLFPTKIYVNLKGHLKIYHGQ